MTQAEADKFIADLTVFVNQRVTPIPAPTGESLSGTWVTSPGQVITDSHGDKWTLDATPWQPYGFKILKNGSWVSGVAAQLAYCGGKILCFNNQSYFNWNGTTWTPQAAGFCPKTN